MPNVYYESYVPANESHFNAMLTQFRAVPSKELMEQLVVLWIFDRGVDRQDILVAQGRVERERGWK